MLPLVPLTVIIATIGSLTLAAEEFSTPRYWRLKGKILANVSLESWTPDYLKVSLKNQEGKTAEVPVAFLSTEDQEFVRKAIEASERKTANVVLLETNPIFKQLPVADRGTLPLLNQSEYGQKSSDCVPSSFCNFALWWDQENILPIGKRGDFDDKAEWIHTQMARLCRTRNTAGTAMSDAAGGFHKYFDKELPELSAYATKVDYDIRPENLARYTIGYNATLLSLTTERGNSQFGHMVALLSASPTGDVVFHTWGFKVRGKIVLLEKKDDSFGGFYGENRKPVNATTYEIKVEPDDKFPDWMKQTRFILDPEEWDALLIVKPYVFAQAGVKSNAPDDPLMATD